MGADEEERYHIASLGPDNAEGSAGAGFEDFVRSSDVELFDVKANRSLAGMVVGLDPLVGIVNKRLLVMMEAVEALEIALLVEKLHLPIFHASF